jgi:transposase-like protein
MGKKKRQDKKPAVTGKAGPVPYEVRLRIVREALRGARLSDVALAFGISTAAVQKYLGLFRSGGVEALRPRLSGCRRVIGRTSTSASHA